MSVFLFIILSILATCAIILNVFGLSAPLVQAALVFVYVLIDGSLLGWPGFGIIAVAAVIAELIEFFAGVRGAKKAGGSRRAGWGAIIGGIIGAIAFTPFGFIIGSIFGSFLGTFAGAWLFEFSVMANSSHAIKVGFWAMCGKVAGFAIKAAVSIAIAAGIIITGIISLF
jgi:uncharacterized protein YqgC (DUF456 family)